MFGAIMTAYVVVDYGRQQALNLGRIQPAVGPVLSAVIKRADIKLDVQVGQSADPPDTPNY